MPIPDTAKEIMEALPEVLQPDRAKGMDATFQFELSGEGGGTWVAKIADGQCTVTEGGIDNPSATISLAAADYVAIAQGKLDMAKAFVVGKIKVKGDMSLIMKLPDLFKTG
ncbi:MAG: SCP2 sterol-binding domain-containing protein [Anaerolineae bacterium]